jgi:ketosteroid isomerase-like protein
LLAGPPLASRWAEGHTGRARRAADTAGDVAGNVDLVLRACAAWQRFEPEEIASFYAADAEIVSKWAEVFGRTFHGRDGLLKWIRDFSAAFERPDLEYEHVADAGDQVVVLEHVRTRGRTSEAEVSLRLAHVYTVRDGLIARQVLHEDLGDALEAVAVRE